MNKEIRQCQNCKQSFVIEPEDFAFYEKINVPAPTWCPECRLVRRITWRNERSLYHRKCDLCKRDLISMYTSNVPFPVYCHDCWWSDKWDPLRYSQNYDFSKPFFEQYKNLLKSVPRFNLYQRNTINSPYTNIVVDTKNSYLSYSLTGNSEEIFYSKTIDRCRNVFDSLSVQDSEVCYENNNSNHNYNSAHLLLVRNCTDSWFLFDCVNCQSCFLSSNLRNKRYAIKNKIYSKNDYERELNELNLGSFKNNEKLKREFEERRRTALHKYADIIKSVSATGDSLHDVKNAKWCFESYNVENVKHIFRTYALKDSMDTNFTGLNSELIYEYTSGGVESYNVKFSLNSSGPLRDCVFCDMCGSSSNLFSCIGLRSKQHCIFNKQYTKEEYDKLVSRIIEHMNTMPYVDAKGRVYKYGEFFPAEISPFAYNETIAQEYFPLTKEESVEKGYKWRDLEERHYEITKTTGELPDHVKNVSDSITQEVIQCAHYDIASRKFGCNEQCTTAFKIIEPELQFLRKVNLPLPRLCPNCRHYQRLKQRNPLKLWHRKCTCAGTKSENHIYQNTVSHFHGASKCPNEFETPYAPERSEIVYCEQCYNAEVV